MKRKLKPYLLISPSLIVFLIFIIIPFFYTLYLSFFDWNMISANKEFVGFGNYLQVFTDPITRKVLKNTLGYILILVLFNFVIPYVIAYIINIVLRKGQKIYRSVLFFPSIISLVIGSVLYTWILNPVSGPLAIILKNFGMSLPNWTKTEGWVIVGICIITTWKAFGYNFIVLVSGIAGIDDEIIEAAKLDGASNFRLFFDIVVPMSSATGIFVLITSIVQGLQFVFTPVKVVTQGGPNYASSNLIYQSYHEAFTLYRTGTSSALSMITMVIFVVLLLLEFKFVERDIHYEI